MFKRLFDIFFSIFGLLISFPILLILAILIKFSSAGPIFFCQERVGKDFKTFQLLKFRSMKIDAEKSGQITIGGRDPRITRIGYFIRKYKMDELPQFINILKGEMSFVGPRPEVIHYVNMYNDEQKKVLKVKPGLTDLASLKYFNENELLGASDDPERTYIEEVMPDKLSLNQEYVDQAGLWMDLKIIVQTLMRIIK